VLYERMQQGLAPAGMKKVVQTTRGARFDCHDPVNPDEPPVGLQRESRKMTVRQGYAADGFRTLRRAATPARVKRSPHEAVAP
jgi:hypothetical protein